MCRISFIKALRDDDDIIPPWQKSISSALTACSSYAAWLAEQTFTHILILTREDCPSSGRGEIFSPPPCIGRNVLHLHNNHCLHQASICLHGEKGAGKELPGWPQRRDRHCHIVLTGCVSRHGVHGPEHRHHDQDNDHQDDAEQQPNLEEVHESVLARAVHQNAGRLKRRDEGD